MVQGKVRFALASMLVCLTVAGGGVARAATPLPPPPYAYQCNYWPVVISQPGSYVLTANLVLPCNKDAIDITADNVTLDLGGYSIIGLGGSSTGIGVSAGSHSNIKVMNGSVVKMGGGGISSGAITTVKDVTINSSGGNGITLGARRAR